MLWQEKQSSNILAQHLTRQTNQKSNMKTLLLILGLLLAATPLHAQNVRVDFQASTISTPNNSGRVVQIPRLAVPGASVSFFVCSGASASTCGTPASTYNSPTSATACPSYAQVNLQGSLSCSSTTDPQGNFGAWVLPGSTVYAYTYTSPTGVTTGPIMFTAGGGGSSGSSTATVNYGQTFSNATTVILLNSQHLLATTDIIPKCFDGKGNALADPSTIVNQATYDVTVSFAQPQTGYCVLNGTGGAGGAALTRSAL